MTDKTTDPRAALEMEDEYMENLAEWLSNFAANEASAANAHMLREGAKHIRRLASRAAAPVPEDWVLVPQEPTRKILAALRDIAQDSGEGWSDEDGRTAWRELIESASAAPAAQGVEDTLGNAEVWALADAAIRATYPDTYNKGPGWWGAQRIANFGILRGNIFNAITEAIASRAAAPAGCDMRDAEITSVADDDASPPTVTPTPPRAETLLVSLGAPTGYPARPWTEQEKADLHAAMARIAEREAADAAPPASGEGETAPSIAEIGAEAWHLAADMDDLAMNGVTRTGDAADLIRKQALALAKSIGHCKNKGLFEPKNESS